jgi:CheY-like chemotaxis protein
METPLRVLVVDDELPNLQTFRRVYRKLYDVTIAPSGPEALEVMNDQQFDVVLSDFGMPGMSGAEFVSKARCVQPVAVVMVTGYMSLPEVVELEASGAIFAIVGKPWEKQSIIDVVTRASECTRSMRSQQLSA